MTFDPHPAVDPYPAVDSSPAPPPRAGKGVRALALAGGLAALALVTVGTLGFALLALLGMAVAWAVARGRGRPLTRGASWWGASLGVALGFAATMAFALAKTPPGTMTQIQQRNDSLRAASPPPEPPAWLRRIDPMAGKMAQDRDSTAERLARSPILLVWAGAMSTVLASSILGALVGSLGWGAALLFLFGATGRWLPRREVRAAIDV